MEMVLPQPGRDSDQQISGSKPRPRERVLEYLNGELNKEGLRPGARLPTSRDLAERLGVSVSTVQSVYQRLSKQGIISTAVGSGTFLVRMPDRMTDVDNLRIGVTFGISAGNQPSDSWHVGVAGSLFEHAATVPGQTSLIPINLLGKSETERFKILDACAGRIDGLILRPLSPSKELREWVASRNYPVVHLNPPELSATQNFVSSDYYTGTYSLGKAMVSAGRRRIAFSYVGTGPSFGVSFLHEYSGLAASAICSEASVHLASAKESTPEAGYDLARRLFDKKGLHPDAVVTSRIEVAHGVLAYCREKGISIPGDVGLVTFSSPSILPDEGKCEISQLHQNTRKLGIGLVDMLRTMVSFEQKTMPGHYIPFEFTPGATTLKVENKSCESNLHGST